jgi:hypothetical protein
MEISASFSAFVPFDMSDIFAAAIRLSMVQSWNFSLSAASFLSATAAAFSSDPADLPCCSSIYYVLFICLPLRHFFSPFSIILYPKDL